MLTEQRKRFVDEYLRLGCKNATQAAINAGYSKKTAHSQASNIMKDSEVLLYLGSRKNEIARELQREFIFDALEARKVMLEILRDKDSSDKNKITIAKDFLNRAGFKPKDEVEHSGEISVKTAYENMSEEELTELAKKYEKINNAE